MDVKNELVFLEKYNGLPAGVSFPPSSRASRVSLAPKIPFPFPFKRPRRLLCTTARSIINFMRTALSCLCFFFCKSGGRNNAKYAFQYTFKHCLKMTPHNMKKKKKKKLERTKYGPSRPYTRWVTHPIPTALNLIVATKPSFAGVIAKYVF